MMGVSGDWGLLVPLLRQSWKLRHDPRLGAEMREDILHCVKMLRHNRRYEEERRAFKLEELRNEIANSGDT